MWKRVMVKVRNFLDRNKKGTKVEEKSIIILFFIVFGIKIIV